MFKSDIEKAKYRKLEEQLYNKVAEELQNGKKHNAIWAKALAYAKGDSGIAQGKYIEYRIESLKDDLIIADENQKIKVQQQEERINDVIREERKSSIKGISEGIQMITAFILLVMFISILGLIPPLFFDISNNSAVDLAFIISIPIAMIIVHQVNKNKGK